MTDFLQSIFHEKNKCNGLPFNKYHENIHVVNN